MTDRGLWVARLGLGGNVRRLMYQSLIWPAVLGDDPGRLGPPLDAEDLQRLADALVDRMRRNVELRRDLLRIQMLVDEAETIKLSLRQPRDSLGYRCARVRGFTRRIMRSVEFVQCNSHPTKHAALPSRVHQSIYVISRTLASFPLI
jgi:hypothetical protein